MSPPIDRKPQLILLLEDDAGVRRAVHLMLCAHGFDVHSHESAGLLLADPAIPGADFLIADYRLATASMCCVRSMRPDGGAAQS